MSPKKSCCIEPSASAYAVLFIDYRTVGSSTFNPMRRGRPYEPAEPRPTDLRTDIISGGL